MLLCPRKNKRVVGKGTEKWSFQKLWGLIRKRWEKGGMKKRVGREAMSLI